MAVIILADKTAFDNIFNRIHPPSFPSENELAIVHTLIVQANFFRKQRFQKCDIHYFANFLDSFKKNLVGNREFLGRVIK
jgi:hypothetical protein